MDKESHKEQVALGQQLAVNNYMKKTEKFIFCALIILYFGQNCISQPFLSVNTDFGINTPYKIRSSVFEIKKFVPSLTFNIGVGGGYKLLDDKIMLSSGLCLTYIPMTILVNFASSSQIEEDIVRVNSKFVFFSVPLLIGLQGDSDFGFIGGLNFKFLSKPISDSYFIDDVSSLFIIKKVNWGLMLGINYEINPRLNLSLKTDFEMPGFISDVFNSGVISNFNTMIGVSYKFNLI